nr:protein kinase [Kofleriaceae bacterium]
MTHLDDDELAAFVDGAVGPDARARIEAHAAACDSCRELLSTLARDGAQTLRDGGTVVPRRPTAGRYQLARILGAGGMGIVYAARDPELERTVAVKLLRADIDQDRLRREAQAMAMVSHPNVVAVHDVGLAGDRVFIAMEFVDGETLAQWLATPRTTAEVLATFDAAGRGLVAVHALRLVHRDFKPENVMVGPGARVRVSDFGVATQAMSTSILGTPYYMAPEQCRGETLDARADQFSFCVALYAALFGVRPFAGTTIDELCAAAVARRRTPPPDPARVPARVLAAVVRGLAPTAAERWPTMEALLAELAPPPPPRAARRWPIAAGAAVVAAGAVVAYAWPREPAAPVVDLELPAIIAPATTPGRALAPSFVEPASQDRLGSRAIAATWCEPRAAAIVVTAYGRVAAIDARGVVTTLATLPRRPVTSLAAAVHCRRTGEVVVAEQAGGAVISATGVALVSPPPEVIEAIDAGGDILWLGPGAVWSWDGSAPPRRVRATCARPLALSPDGARTACLDDGHVVVDSLVGPPGTAVLWADDALYVTDHDVVTRWELAGGRRVVATGASPTAVGPWLVTRDLDELEMTWRGPGPARELPPIELGSKPAGASILARIADHAVVTVDEQTVRVVELDRPAPPLPANRHTAPIAVIAFRGDAVIAASEDGRVIAHAGGARTLIARATAPVTAASTLVAGTGAIVNGAALVAGRDVVVHSAIGDGVTLDDGRVLVPPPLPRETQVLAVSADLGTVLVRAGDRARLLEHGEPIASVKVPARSLVRLAVGPAIAITDASGQAFAVDAGGVTPLLKLPEPITALAASPTAPVLAIGAGRVVVIYDLAARRELARGATDSTVGALAFSADGTRVAAAAASTQITIWTY